MTPEARLPPADPATPRGDDAACVAAFDPGRNIGFALVTPGGAVRALAIVRLSQVADLPLPDGATVVVGSGTGRDDLVRELVRRERRVTQVDERDTSLVARELWRRSTPPRGLTRLVPAGLRAPPGPIDDYAAWAIALRYLGIAAADAPVRPRGR